MKKWWVSNKKAKIFIWDHVYPHLSICCLLSSTCPYVRTDTCKSSFISSIICPSHNKGLESSSSSLISSSKAMQLWLQAVRNATSRYHNTKSVTEKLAGPRLEVTRIHDHLTLLDFATRVKTHLTLPYKVINDQMDCIHQLTPLMSTHGQGLFASIS